MAKLILNPTSPARRDFPLPRTVLSIGRDPSNDLVLPDAMVSRRHAVIECRGAQYYLRDCNSSNGSLVNGDRVSERGLRDGDLVAIGTVRLMFREELEPAEPGAKVVQHPSAPRMVCSTCQADYRQGDLFCRHCGGRLQDAPPRALCTSCGTAVLLPARFCNACGASLARPKDDGAAEASAGAEPTQPHERTDELGLDAVPPVSVKDRQAGEPVRAAGADAAPGPAAPQAGNGGARAALAPAQPASIGEREPRPHVPALRAVPLRAPRPARPATVVPTDAQRETTHAIESRPPAAPGERLLAALVDGALVSLGMLVLAAPGALYWRHAAADPAGPSFLAVLVCVTLGVSVLLLSGAYYVGFWGLSGATPGKRLLGLRVYGLDGRFPVGMPRAFLRLLGYLMSAAALGLGFVVILFGATSLHDRVARTVVVRERPR